MESNAVGTQKSTIAGVSQLLNSSPSKIQPWKQENNRIPARSQACSDPDSDSTHGVPKGSWLIMQNAPAGLRPQNTIKEEIND
jgi:hypothetical protein